MIGKTNAISGGSINDIASFPFTMPSYTLNTSSIGNNHYPTLVPSENSIAYLPSVEGAHKLDNYKIQFLTNQTSYRLSTNNTILSDLQNGINSVLDFSNLQDGDYYIYLYFVADNLISNNIPTVNLIYGGITGVKMNISNKTASLGLNSYFRCASADTGSGRIYILGVMPI